MTSIDWIVLFGTLLLIVAYGIYRTRGSKNINSYLRGDSRSHWWTIGLSIMATQASAITFLSTPGQAFRDGMGFIQFYLGLPLAMIVISTFILPIYYKLKIYTAYEYLESRFDLKTRIFGAFLFLLQRGLAAGITIYAPAIILSTILNWPLIYTIFIIGFLVILYTVTGGSRAVSQTQKHQMIIMMGGMITAGIIVIQLLPENVGLGEAYSVAGNMGKLNLINLEFNINDRYNLWTGLLGGFFVALSYFGTDQSQVARYLSGKSLTEARLGMMFNGLLKIPMQFIILFIGAMVFVFYQFNQPPLFFNEAAKEAALETGAIATKYTALEDDYSVLFEQKKEKLQRLVEQGENAPEALKNEINDYAAQEREYQLEAKELIAQSDKDLETEDTDYVFISFVMKYLPTGVIGLLLAVIFSAAMSSSASELNALASTTVIDLYKRNIKKDGSDQHYLIASKAFTLLWGIVAMLFAAFAGLLDNLIQAVNILGSIFYGTILGVFIVGFFIKWIKGNAVFIAALISQTIVIMLYFTTELAFLWFNVIGCGLVLLISAVLQLISKSLKL